MQSGQEAIEAEKSGPGLNYSKQWSAYAKRRNLAFFLLFGVVPFGVTACLFAQYRLGQPLPGLVATLIWFGLTCLAVWWSGEFRCPRCLRRFGALGSKTGVGRIWCGLFDKACSNCKLRRWENG